MLNLQILSQKDYEQMKRKEIKICFGFHSSPFGKCLVGLYGKNVCHISFVVKSESENLTVLKRQWPGSTFIKEEKQTKEITEEIFGDDPSNLSVMMKGTHFQSKVWQALMDIPKGTTVSYEDIAIMVGNRKAVRAVANAIAKNPVAYLVPCHRVIKKDGSLHKYGWGPNIKKKMLQFENCYFN